MSTPAHPPAPIPTSPVTVRTGDSLPRRRHPPLTRSDIVRYAGAAGDFNPLHHDEPMARAAGTPSVFAMGLLHAGMLGIQLARWLGPDNIRSFAVRYTAPVWPGDELTFSGEVTEICADGMASLSLAITRQTGQVVVRAVATAITAPPRG